MVNNFFSRWSQRKLDGDNPDSAVSQDTSNFQGESSKVNAESENLAADGVGTDKLDIESVETTTSDESLSETELLNDAPLEEVAQETSLAQLLVSGAEAGAKKAAMRKLFLSGEFSEVDRLNDYDHDYSSVKSLSTEAASKLRNWVNEKLEEDEAEEEIVEADSNESCASSSEVNNSDGEEQKENTQETISSESDELTNLQRNQKKTFTEK
ncbi:DUF3306 domain-containing protein [Vibrio sp. 99-70-13A1]|uniref:DUF3306 domain-containing protein n=1 Tax=Vibrio sp. 99-70-13A1 TaxID=2607601 RepID=UPI0014933112|nr:DUF3306 domain-containing protein [Vibrio sp. 99-70-13A1]